MRIIIRKNKKVRRSVVNNAEHYPGDTYSDVKILGLRSCRGTMVTRTVMSIYMS
jgi:hypothetical protein